MKSKIWSYFRDTTAYAIARGIKNGMLEVQKEIKQRKAPEKLEKAVVSLYPQDACRGKVLLSYMIEGFLLKPGTPIPKTHTNLWQTVKMAEIFLSLGYEVDVINYTNNSFIPTGNYSFLVDIRHNLKRLAPLLNKDCIKIMHLDTAHILFHNAAESKRLLQLQERREITLRPRRFERPNLGIEFADYATTGGNDFTVDTFKYSKKKIFKLPSPCGIMLDWPKKDWDKCRKRFLWFSSRGLVFKGLDLALEAFKEMPDCHLTICAPLNQDKDFVDAYHKELFETSNITTVGWVDIDSSKFRDITTTCVANLHLSCSEGGAPSVKMCMHAGLIPVVSYESGVDVNDFGYELRDCSIQNIVNIVTHITQLSKKKIQEMSRSAWIFARRHHTRENFAKEYRRVILGITEEMQGRNIDKSIQRYDHVAGASISVLR